MAFLQRAWVFGPRAFHVALARAVGERASDVAVLREEAIRRIAGNWSDEYLRMIEIGGPEDLEDASLGKLYVACMAPSLTGVDSISDAGWLLNYLQNHIGCDEAVCRALIYGEPLRTMLDAVPSDPLAMAIVAEFPTGYGGWLPGEAAARLLGYLEQLEPVFVRPSETFVNDYASAFRATPDRVIARTAAWFREATALLGQVSSGSDKALRLVAP